MSSPPARKRRSLSAPAGAVSLAGDVGVAGQLRAALCVPPLPEQFSAEERSLVENSLSLHLFHSFAARTHPLTVRHLLRQAGPGQTVLDPFCGSGTVLVEAALRGARGAGLDLGALQVRLSRFKATPMPASMRRALLRLAEQVAQASQDRVERRQRPGRTWDDARHYEPHVYLELCGLREEIESVSAQDPPLYEALLLTLSAILIKVSRQRAESSDQQVVRSLAKGQATRWFLYKAQELCRLLAAFAERAPAPPRPVVVQGDARSDIERLSPPVSADMVVTSPPYLGVYDYAAHHARRHAFLDLDPAPLLQAELGARRYNQGALSLQEMLARHQADMDAWVGGAARALRPGGQAYVIVGDSRVDPAAPLSGDGPIRRAAEGAGLLCVASCSVDRGGGLREHLLCLRKG